MGPRQLWEVLRPREKAMVVVVAVVFLGLLARSVSRAVGIGPSDRTASVFAVDEALALHAAAGDPVPIAEREWPPALDGVPMEEFESEGRPASKFLLDPDALAERREHHGERVAEHAVGVLTREKYDACAIWSASRAQLTELYFQNGLLERDPARWRAATDDQRILRAVFAFLRTDDRRDASPCTLGHRSGRARLEASESSDSFEDDSTAEPIDWFIEQGEPRLAAITWAALRGSVPETEHALREAVCLLRSTGTPVQIPELYPCYQLVEQVLREAEACLPLLGPEGAGLLTSAVELCEGASYLDGLRLALRGERAMVHAQYLELLEMESSLESLLYSIEVEREGDFEPSDLAATPCFLDYLRDSDRALALLDLPFEQASKGLADLQEERSERGWFCYYSQVVFPLADGLFGDVLEADATVACAAVAGIAATDGAEAGRAAAARSRDPFTGEPLRTRVREDGVFEVWSVGVDLLDDGGSSATQRNSDDLDIVFRVELP